MDAAVKQLATFASIEKIAVRWVGKRGHSRYTMRDLDQNEEKLKERRDAFLKRAHKTEEELKEQQEKRRAAAKHVRQALKAKEQLLVVSRPLRRFDVKLMVTIIHHQYNSKTKRTSTKRMMVVMNDKLRYDKLPSWTAQACGIDPKKKLLFEYIMHTGRAIKIDSKAAWQGWLDTMWAAQPPKLHVCDEMFNIEEALDRTQEIRELFDEYDKDNSGGISPTEMTEMIVEMDLAGLGVSKDDIANYVAEEFERVDTDKSGSISFDEFVQYYNSLKDFLRDKLTTEGKHTNALIKFREEFTEAKSLQQPLVSLVDGHPPLPTGRDEEFSLLALRKGRSGAGGVMLLEAHGHRFGIEVIVPKSAVGASLRNHYGAESKYIRAETVIPSQIDYFSDPAAVIGSMFSPTVSVEFESHADQELEDVYHVVIPHCLGSTMSDREPLKKEDVAVCFATWEGKEWYEVDPSSWELLPPRVHPAHDVEMPCVSVSMVEAGIVSVFSRSHPMRAPKTRVRCIVCAPHMMSPLEMHLLRLHIVPAIPDEIEAITVLEKHDRGMVVTAGRSDVFEVDLGQRMDIYLGGRLVEHQLRSETWAGETVSVEFDFDPDYMLQILQVGLLIMLLMLIMLIMLTRYGWYGQRMDPIAPHRIPSHRTASCNIAPHPIALYAIPS